MTQVQQTTVVIPEPADETASDAQLARFLKLSGYKKSDVIGSNESRATFVTDNGGSYKLVEKGKRIEVLAGPPFPGAESTAEGLSAADNAKIASRTKTESEIDADGNPDKDADA